MIKIKIFNNDNYIAFEYAVNNFLEYLKEENIIDIKPYGQDNKSIMVVYKEKK